MKNENLPAVARNNGYAPDITGDRITMSEFEQDAHQSGLNLSDILFIFLKHKWKIFLLAIAGFIAAAAVYFLPGPSYESHAKLFVRYVVDRSAVDGLDSQVKTSGSQQSETVINSEVEILTSSDLAMQVAEAIGVERLLPESRGKGTQTDAAGRIVRGLTVTPIKESNIISVSFKNGDPELAVQVLQELVNRYFEKHLEVHRSAGAFDFVTRQADQLRGQLSETENELKQLRAKAGITSLAESTTSIAAELTKSQEGLDAAEAELAAQKARTKEIEQGFAAAETKQSDKDNATPRVNNRAIQEYQSLEARVTQLRQAETELLSRYTSENRVVKVKHAQIEDLENQRRNLEKKYPGLLAVVPGGGSAQDLRPDPMSERARLVEIEARTETLRSRLKAVQERAKVLSELSPRIAQLERTKEVEEANYKYFEASLEKARVDETLDPSRMPNISVVQKPSAAVKSSGVPKIVIGLAAGGLAVGIAIALLIELVIDRTVKRSLELERQLRIPLLLSIPNFSSNGHRLRLRDKGHDSELVGDGDARGDLVPVDAGELLRPFCEAIRDRLGVFFRLNNMSHRPKLVAVTGLSKNAGASTLAAGLASCLSEGTEGKVLFVDQPVAPKKFYNMLTDFKASDLDYVVFDMPSLGDTSATLPLAGFMDTVLLVVEAEKSNRDAVKRAYAQLVAKTTVSVIFNKSRSYGPKWIEGEL